MRVERIGVETEFVAQNLSLRRVAFGDEFGQLQKPLQQFLADAFAGRFRPLTDQHEEPFQRRGRTKRQEKFVVQLEQIEKLVDVLVVFQSEQK